MIAIAMNIFDAPLQEFPTAIEGDESLTALNIDTRDRSLRARADELRRENARLKRALRNKDERLHAYARQIEALHGAISGSLRQPIRVVGEMMEALSRDLEAVLDVSALNSFETLRRAAAQTDNKIDALLNASQLAITLFKREDVDLATLTREIAVDLSWNRRGRPVELTVAESVKVSGEASKLRLLMTALLARSWGRAARQAEGRVRVAVGDGGGGEKVYSVSDNAIDNDQDSGEDMGRLVLASQVVQRHGGHLWSERAAGRGVAICFTLG